MDHGTLAGWVSGLAGAAIGLLGGALGTLFSIKNTKGPRERAFMIKAAIGCWLLVAVFIAGLMLSPPAYKILLVLAYMGVLLWGIRTCNATQQRIRNEESGRDA